jgi:hypothetical protein
MKSALRNGSLLVSALLVACALASPASAKTRHHKASHDLVPWHGWGDSFHYAGIRYPGGKKWLHKFGRCGRWIGCLTAGTVVLANQERR